MIFALFFEFFKTGLFAIGGGLATLPFLYEMSSSTGWFTMQDISNLVAISESTPGPLGVNMATYVGYTTLGIFGGLISTLGLITPSVIIIILVSKILERFKTNKYVQYAMYGLRAASSGLIFCAGLQVAKVAFLHPELLKGGNFSLSVVNWISLLYGIVLYIVYKKTNKHPILYIVASGVLGVLLRL